MSKDFKEAFRKIANLVKDISDKKHMKSYAKDTRDMVKKRTQLGYGVKNRKKSKLKKLSDLYKKQRRRKKSSLSGNTSPAKSNLTKTGKMLEEMNYKSTKDEFTIGFSTTFAKQKAKWNTDKLRPFMELSKQEVKRLRDIIQNSANSLIKKLK